MAAVYRAQRIGGAAVYGDGLAVLPTLVSVSGVSTAPTTATITVTSTGSGGTTLYLVAYDSSLGTPSAAQIAAGLDINNVAAAWDNGGAAWTGSGQQSFATGLTGGASYKTAVTVYDSGTASYSNVVVSAAWTQAQSQALALLVETDEAQAISAFQPGGLALLEESDTAQALTVAAGAVVVGLAQLVESDAAQAITVSAAGGTASAADVWSYVLSNGLTAEQTLVAVHTWLSELHLIHGLTAGSPLSVTAASRAAGAVSQAVAEAAGTVTVTRQ